MKTYLYNYKYLYPVGAAQEDVQELTLRCHSIEPTNKNFLGGSQWNFKVEGRGDQLFRTSYDWALVEDSVENLKLLFEFEECHEKRRALQRKASAIFKQVKTWASENDN